MSGLTTIAEMARHLNAALVSEQTEHNLDPSLVKPTAFYDGGATVTVTRHGSVVRVSASAEAGRAIVADLDLRRGAALGFGLVATSAVSQTAGVRE